MSSTSYPLELEHKAALLKERIYATIALLAVLITINPLHTSVGKAFFIIGGTAVSLWAASLVSTIISRRIVLHEVPRRIGSLKQHVIRHVPILSATVFPLVSLALSAMHLLTLHQSLMLAIIVLHLSLLGWAVHSARVLRLNAMATVLLATAMAVLGLLVVGVKAAVAMSE